MTPYRIIYSRRSLTDLTRIREGLVIRSSAAVAADVLAKIIDGIDKLADTPNRAIVVDQPASPLDPVRSVATGKYIVHFRVNERTTSVQILRVRHSKQKLLRRFS